MTQDLIDRSRRRHTFTDTALFVLIAALAIALVVAAIVVSVGMARADTLGQLAASGTGRAWLAVLAGGILAGMGGLTAIIVNDSNGPQRPD